MNKPLSKEIPRRALVKFLPFITLLIALSLLTLVWRLTPLRSLLTTAQLLSLATLLRSDPLAPLLIILTYVVGGLVSFPIAILIPVTAFIFGPVYGPCYSLVGVMLNASILYALGHFLGHTAVRKLGGTHVNYLSQRLAHHGLFTIATLRAVPLAPFTVVNLVAGASHIRFRDYTTGTLIGIAPALMVMSLIGVRLEKAVRNPLSADLLIVAELTILMIVATLWLKYRFFKRGKENKLSP